MKNWWRANEELMRSWRRADDELMKSWWRNDDDLMKNWWKADKELMKKKVLCRDVNDGIMHYAIIVVTDMRSINGFSSIVCESAIGIGLIDHCVNRVHRARLQRSASSLRCNRKQTNKMAASVEKVLPWFNVIHFSEEERSLSVLQTVKTQKSRLNTVCQYSKTKSSVLSLMWILRI